MISLTYLSVFVLCLAWAAADEQQTEGTTPEPVTEVAPVGRELTDTGYVIRYGDQMYRYPMRIVPFVRTGEGNPTETNEIENEEDKKRPLFYFTTYELADGEQQQKLPTSGPYIEIRRKRDLENSEIPESSKIGKLRRKRTYCRKCGGGGGYGGYGGFYIPVSFAVYPVYYSSPGNYGCNTCGGKGGNYGGGGGGSYSYSSSSSHSSSGSFGWGKK